MSVKNQFTEAMLNVAGEFNDLFEAGASAEKGPNPPIKYGQEKMSSKSSWQTSWQNMTPFQRTMELDSQGQGAILGNLQGYNGGNL
jgi:hypothetical protein